MLRRLLTCLGIPVWKHFYTGLSRWEIAGIDIYMKTLTPTMRSTAGERAHIIANVSLPFHFRRQYRQEDWWLCPDWKFSGQVDPFFDTAISDPRIRQLTHAIAQNPRAGMGSFHTYIYIYIFLFLLKTFFSEQIERPIRKS